MFLRQSNYGLMFQTQTMRKIIGMNINLMMSDHIN